VRYSKNQTKGFTLIEVLISVLIMAVGVLGATGLQHRGLDANRDALMRGEATLLARDIANRIEVNPGAAYAVAATTTPSASSNNCTIDNCNPTEMAAYDITQWKCSINSIDSSGTGPVTYPPCDTLAGLDISGSLPNGKGAIVVAGDEYTITVSWQPPKYANASSVSLIVGVP
jgi:type IV pilus assembly protein PilV